MCQTRCRWVRPDVDARPDVDGSDPDVDVPDPM